MNEFYSVYGLKNPSIWFDLTYGNARNLLISVKEKSKNAPKENIATKPSWTATVAPAPMPRMVDHHSSKNSKAISYT